MSLPQDVYGFLVYAYKEIEHAKYIGDSIPNVEEFAVEKSLRVLCAIHRVLSTLNVLSEMKIMELQEITIQIAALLVQHQDHPEPMQSSGIERNHTGRPGRPGYFLDLQQALHLHNLGCTWSAIADAMGIARSTLYSHLNNAGISTSRPAYTSISDDDLDGLIAAISIHHPLAGAAIVKGHLESQEIYIPILRIRESLQRVDAIGVHVRWGIVIHRRVYRVRGANSLWHHDGNEKLKPWGFYVHGCVDGYSRLIIYIVCCNNKRAATVESIFMKAVQEFGWPSRVRGDWGTENNRVEQRMNEKRGQLHKAYLRGRSTQNIRMERTWRDVRKDTLEIFRQIFFYLEGNGLLDMNNVIQRLCLYLVYQPRIQASLERTKKSWNLHKLRTEHHKSPQSLYELSRAKAMSRGYWYDDPGDSVAEASGNNYGQDDHDILPPMDELKDDPYGHDDTEFRSVEQERGAGILVNEDVEIQLAKEVLEDLDVGADDGNWGIDMYCQAVVIVETRLHMSRV